MKHFSIVLQICSLTKRLRRANRNRYQSTSRSAHTLMTRPGWAARAPVIPRPGRPDAGTRLYCNVIHSRRRRGRLYGWSAAWQSAPAASIRPECVYRADVTHWRPATPRQIRQADTQTARQPPPLRDVPVTPDNSQATAAPWPGQGRRRIGH